jgi:peptidoglycan lytic transglycosylase
MKHNPPMRMLILLTVFSVAGSWLLAAESPSTPKPADPATTTQSDTKTDAAKTDAAKTDPAKTDAAKTDAVKADTAKAGAAKTDAAKTDAKADAKAASKDGDKKSIADQAEAALKAAYEADPKVPAKGDPDAKDDTQAPPTAKGPSPQRFTPTEQVRADFDVSFPIDI